LTLTGQTMLFKLILHFNIISWRVSNPRTSVP
jgi:hypothetical protein